MKILIGSDFVPTVTNKDLFAAGNAEELVGKDLLELLSSADYRIFNLEVPLTDVETPIEKCGPALIAPTNTIAGYKALAVDCLSIANNHIMDQDVQGIRSTLTLLRNEGINTVGGGENLIEAQRFLIVEFEGKKIGIYACAETEFSIASEDTPGANPFDPLESPDHVASLKAKCDFVVVLYHGGKEHYRYPSPALQKVCRKLVDKGADLVICQHSHCIGCEEKYQNGTIIYGQGNFLFDYSARECWKTGLLIEVASDFSVSYFPLVKCDNTVRLAKRDEAEQILGEFVERSREIQEPGFVQKKYQAFAQDMQETYLRESSTFDFGNLVFRVFNKMSGHRFGKWILKRKYEKRKRMKLCNLVECEAHRELLLAVLKN